MGVALMANAFGSSGESGAMGSAMMAPPSQGQYAVGGNVAAGASVNTRAEVFCFNCGKKYSTTSRFCSFCGDPYNSCPVCGADNSTTAKRCVSCGAQLQSAAPFGNSGNSCSKCGTAVQPGIKFCPTCGNKLM